MLKYYIVYFIILSFVGYIYECIAMTLWSGKWDNRGFLFGPIIPIYGFGALIGLIIFNQIYVDSPIWLVFLVGFFCSALLEYPTSWILEKAFHAYWWDYSIAPFNINGRISLFSSLGFGIAAVVIVYIINPVLWPFIISINATVLEVLSYLIILALGIDVTLTISVLSSFEDKVTAINNYINDHMNDAVDNINPKGRNIKGAIKATKENLVDAGIDKLTSRMGIMHQRIISRIVGFKNTSPDGNDIKNKIKDKITNKNER